MEIIRSEVNRKEEEGLNKNYPILVSDTIGVTAIYQKLHWHEVLEINLIKAGTGYYIINGQRFDFGKGDILLINSNDLHCAYELEDLVMMVVSFDASWFLNIIRHDAEILSPFTEMGIHFSNLLDAANPHMEELRQILLALQDEHEREQRSYSSVVYSHLLQFLARVNRHFRLDVLEAAKVKSRASVQQLEKIREVVHLMESDLSYNWKLSELAERVYLSPSRFSDLFKQTVGISPMDYLIGVRIDKAVSLLETTDMKVTAIAMECGFRSLSNFNRLFQQRMGMTPRTAKKRVFQKQ